MSDLPTALAKAILATPELLKEIYSDLAKPGVQQVGVAIGGILGLGNTALYHIHLLNERTSIHLKNNLEQYRKKMKEVPQEDVSPVPPEIGVPIAEKLAYVSNAELADMYTSLLAKASSKINADQAHPGFVAMIDRLSPDEAILLKKLQGHGQIPFIEVRFTFTDGTWRTLKDLAVDKTFYEELQQPQNVPAYFANLNALGIVEIQRNNWSAPKEKIYPPLKQYHEPPFQAIPKGSFGKEGAINSVDARMMITDIGRLFISACFSKMKKSPVKQ